MKDPEILEESFLNRKSEIQINWVVVFFWLILFVVGVYRHYYHLHFDATFLFIGSAGFQAYLFVLLIKTKGKNRIVNIFNRSGFIGTLYLLCSAIFNQGIPFSLSRLLPYGVIFLFLFSAYSLYFSRK